MADIDEFLGPADADFPEPGRAVLRATMEAKERQAMNGVSTRRIVLDLLYMALQGGCTHFAATDGSKIGAEASRDSLPHAACGVFEGGCGHWGEISAYGSALDPKVEVPDAELVAVIYFLQRLV